MTATIAYTCSTEVLDVFPDHLNSFEFSVLDPYVQPFSAAHTLIANSLDERDRKLDKKNHYLYVCSPSHVHPHGFLGLFVSA